MCSPACCSTLAAIGSGFRLSERSAACRDNSEQPVAFDPLVISVPATHHSTALASTPVLLPALRLAATLVAKRRSLHTEPATPLTVIHRLRCMRDTKRSAL